MHDGVIRSIEREGHRILLKLTRDTWECAHAGVMESVESELRLSRVIDVWTSAGSIERLLKRPRLMIEKTLLDYLVRPGDWDRRLSFHGRDGRNRRWTLALTLRHEYDIVLTDQSSDP